MLKALLHVSTATLLIACPVLCGLFDSLQIESGLSHYAEKPYWGQEDPCLPSWLPMPANALVNIGYLLIGFLWIYRTAKNPTIDNKEKYFLFAFSWMSILYGIVQCNRILTQAHWAGVLDQWYTFPIFAWGVVWCVYKLHGWNWMWIMTIELVSVCTYLLTFLHPYGFELALSIHILTIVVCATKVHTRFYSLAGSDAFWKAILCCVGFVVLKLLDHSLASWAPLPFQYLSGHFWSKIADVLQIHYVCLFFVNTSSHKKK